MNSESNDIPERAVLALRAVQALMSATVENRHAIDSEWYRRTGFPLVSWNYLRLYVETVLRNVVPDPPPPDLPVGCVAAELVTACGAVRTVFVPGHRTMETIRVPMTGNREASWMPSYRSHYEEFNSSLREREFRYDGHSTTNPAVLRYIEVVR